MNIDGITGIASSGLSPPAANRNRVEDHPMPPAGGADRVTISEAAQTRFESALERVREANANHRILGGYEGRIGIGLMAMGGEDQLERWAAQGLEIDEEAILAAADAFQNAFQAAMGEDSPRGSVAINRYRIVMNAQEVPEWFVSEYRNMLSMMGDSETRRAFERGEVFHALPGDDHVGRGVRAYESISRFSTPEQ